MGKFVDRVKKDIGAVAGKVKAFKLNEDKLFQDLVKKADTLELALTEIVEKMNKLEATLNEVIAKIGDVKEKVQKKDNKNQE